MIKVEVIETFTFARFNEIKDSIKRATRNEEGKLFVGDTFECSKELVDYLTGNNPIKKVVVKVVEVAPAVEPLKKEKKVAKKKNKQYNRNQKRGVL